MTRTGDRSRDHDMVIFGASGFTGELVAEYLVRRYGAKGELRVALAGRSERKLEAVVLFFPLVTPGLAGDLGQVENR